MDYETSLKHDKTPFVVIYHDGSLNGSQSMIPINPGQQFLYETVRTIPRDQADTKAAKKMEPIIDLSGLKGRKRYLVKNKYQLSQYYKDYRAKKLAEKVSDASQAAE